jgi:hypothetical protein
MSTRGCVAVGSKDSWSGIYQHDSSYPTWLGKALWEILIREQLAGKSLADIGEEILRFDDFRNYLSGGVCKYCGKIAGQPHSIRGDVYTKAHDPLFSGFADPDALHHEHNDLHENNRITSANPDPLFIEWVYVIDAPANAVHVLASKGVGEGKSHRWIHECIATLTFDGSVPDWHVIECGQLYERCHHYAYHHFPELKETPSGLLGTRQYIGTDTIDSVDKASAFIISGQRYEKGGSAWDSGFALRSSRWSGKTYRGRPLWVHTLQSEELPDYPVAVKYKSGMKPYPGVQWVIPPTLVNPNETIISGESRKTPA